MYKGCITSADSLASGNTFQTTNHNGWLPASPTTTLEFIQFDKERNPTVSYMPENLLYYYLNGKELNEIDILATNQSP
jgi:hypothetical protein